MEADHGHDLAAEAGAGTEIGIVTFVTIPLRSTMTPTTTENQELDVGSRMETTIRQETIEVATTDIAGNGTGPTQTMARVTMGVKEPIAAQIEIATGNRHLAEGLI